MGTVRQLRSDPAARLAFAAGRCRWREREANGVCRNFRVPGARGCRVRRGFLVLCSLLLWPHLFWMIVFAGATPLLTPLRPSPSLNWSRLVKDGTSDWLGFVTLRACARGAAGRHTCKGQAMHVCKMAQANLRLGLGGAGRGKLEEAPILLTLTALEGSGAGF
jgi:hypothetical protein